MLTDTINMLKDLGFQLEDRDIFRRGNVKIILTQPFHRVRMDIQFENGDSIVLRLSDQNMLEKIKC